jgi:hypothetical protein
MYGHRRPPLSTLLTAAAFGAVAGHAVTYMVAIPDPVTRQLFLAATGHGYLPAVVPAALILGIFAALSTVIRHLGGHRENSVDRWTWGRTIETLGLLQCAIFRSLAPVPMGGLHSRLVAVAGSIRAPPRVASSSLV